MTPRQCVRRTEKRGRGSNSCTQLLTFHITQSTFLSCRLSHTLHPHHSKVLKVCLRTFKSYNYNGTYKRIYCIGFIAFFCLFREVSFLSMSTQVLKGSDFFFFFPKERCAILYRTQHSLWPLGGSIYHSFGLSLHRRCAAGLTQQHNAWEKYEMPDSSFLSCRITELTQLQTNNCRSIFPACLRVIDGEGQGQNEQKRNI